MKIQLVGYSLFGFQPRPQQFIDFIHHQLYASLYIDSYNDLCMDFHNFNLCDFVKFLAKTIYPNMYDYS
jgi:hypothetical protein